MQASLSFGNCHSIPVGQSQGITVALFSPGAVMPCCQHTTSGALESISRTPSVMTGTRTRQVAHFWVLYVDWLAAKCVDSEVLTVELGWIKIGTFEPTKNKKDRKINNKGQNKDLNIMNLIALAKLQSNGWPIWVLDNVKIRVGDKIQMSSHYFIIINTIVVNINVYMYIYIYIYIYI